jgi:Outer membrane protein beta-barrel domain
MRARLAGIGRAAACLAAASLIAGAAQAQGLQAPWRGIYVGGGGNFSDVSVEVGRACYDRDCWWGDYAYYEDGDGDYGYNLHAGWRVHDYVALELGYVDTGDIRWEEDLVYFPEFNDYYNNRVDFSAQITQVSVLGILPFGRFEVYLKLGAGFWDGESVQRLDQSFGNDLVTRQVSDSGTGFLGGVGVGVTFAKALHVRFELQSTTIDEDVLNARNDSSVDAMLLEVQYRFGAGKASSIQPSAPPTANP